MPIGGAINWLTSLGGGSSEGTVPPRRKKARGYAPTSRAGWAALGNVIGNATSNRPELAIAQSNDYSDAIPSDPNVSKSTVSDYMSGGSPVTEAKMDAKASGGNPSLGVSQSGELVLKNKPNWIQRNITGDKDFTDIQNQLVAAKAARNISQADKIEQRKYNEQQDAIKHQQMIDDGIGALLRQQGIPDTVEQREAFKSAAKPFMQEYATTMANAPRQNMDLQNVQAQAARIKAMRDAEAADLDRMAMFFGNDSALAGRIAEQRAPYLKEQLMQNSINQIPAENLGQALSNEALRGQIDKTNRTPPAVPSIYLDKDGTVRYIYQPYNYNEETGKGFSGSPINVPVSSINKSPASKTVQGLLQGNAIQPNPNAPPPVRNPNQPIPSMASPATNSPIVDPEQLRRRLNYSIFPNSAPY